MLKNYIKVAFRNLWQNKIYGAINVFGLAVGIACCILIFLYVRHEFSHDRFHKNADSIYRLLIQENWPDGRTVHSPLFPLSLALAIKDEIPGVALTTGFMRSNARVYLKEQWFWEKFALVQPPFLDIFTFPLLVGDPATALRQPNNIIISEAIAQKFFAAAEGDYDKLIGKVLTLKGREPLEFAISGVMQNVPVTSSFEFDLIVPIENWTNFTRDNRWSGETTIYLQLAENRYPESIEAVLPSFLEGHLGARIKERRTDFAVLNTFDSYRLYLQPLTDIYLNSEIFNHYAAHGNVFYSYILSAIALLVLIIACINFMTLTIGRSAGRAMEVGVRKVHGAQRQQLLWQFWGEALLLATFALLAGVLLAKLFLPVFNDLAATNLTLSLHENWQIPAGLLAILLLAGLIAGSYPAFALSRLQPITVFKNQTGTGGRNRFTRTLVVIQYTLSIALIISTGIMLRQLDYMRTKSLGYDKEQIVIVSFFAIGDDTFWLRYKTRIAQHEKVIRVSGSDRAFTTGSSSREIKLKTGEKIRIRQIRVDSDYLETLGIELLAGQNFASDIPIDKQSVIVNEALVKAYGWEHPIGEVIDGLNDTGQLQVIGVVRDFHIDRLHRQIEPLVLHENPDFHGIYQLLIRVQTDDLPGAIAGFRQAWNELAPPYEPFQYSFLDENLDRQYQSEQRWSTIIGYTALFAILISCLGLLGLAALAVNRRTKEIGIRKVLGATVQSIVALISKDFVKLVLVAFIVATPIAWKIMQTWLQNFAYRIDMGWWIFIVAGTLALAIALLAISTQSIKAAIANPVEALRYE